MKNSNKFQDDTIGIEFVKPTTWFFLSHRNIEEQKSKQILADGSIEFMEDFQMTKKELFEFLGQPICIMTKYNPDDATLKGKFSPTITILATLKETVVGNFGVKTFEDVINRSRQNIPDFLKDFKVLKEYGQSKIDGKKSYQFDTTYSFNHVDLIEEIKVEMKSIKIESDKFYFDIDCHSSIQVNEGLDDELKLFIDSIKIK